MSLLILSPNYSKRVNWGHQHIRDTLLDLVESGVQYGQGCRFFGETHIPTICKQLEDMEVIEVPSHILMENPRNVAHYTGGAEVDAIKAFMVCDYFPDSRGNYSNYNRLLNEHDVTIAICPTPDVVNNIKGQRTKGALKSDINPVWIPHAVNTDIFKRRGLQKEYDVMAVFGLVSYVYPNRPIVQKALREMKGVNALIGDWKSGIIHYSYAEAINKSKIFVCANGINNQVLMKYFEAMASGTFLLTNLPNSWRDFGFIPGRHFVIWRDVKDLEDTIRYFLAHEVEREEIASEGEIFVRENFNCQVIAKKIVEALGCPTLAKEEGRFEGFIGE